MASGYCIGKHRHRTYQEWQKVLLDGTITTKNRRLRMKQKQVPEKIENAAVAQKPIRRGHIKVSEDKH